MSTEQRVTTNYNKPMSAEERGRMMKMAGVLVGAAIIFMVGFGLLVHYDLVHLYPSDMKAEMLKGFSARLEFTLRYQTLLVFWLHFNVFATICGRFMTKALNPLYEETEQRVQIFKNILTNSLESIVISVFSQLIFISFAESLTILKWIPYINIVQFIGRIAFFAGYPLKRSFGFNCTGVPNLVMAFYNLYKLGSFVGFY